MDKAASPPAWLWRGLLLSLALLLTGGAALATGIAAGYHNPRPAAAPTWQLAAPLSLAVAPGDETALRVLTSASDSFTLQALVSLERDAPLAACGLLFAQNGDSYTVFAVGSDGYLALWRVEEGGETVLLDWQQFPHIHRGAATNLLRLSCDEGACGLWVNDEYVTTVTGLDPAGGVGVWLSGQTQATFERISLVDDKTRSLAPCGRHNGHKALCYDGVTT